MRLRIAHEIVARFDPPATQVIRQLRMTPRTYDGQYVGTWRIDVDQDCRLDRDVDAFGNVTHNFSVFGPVAALAILVTGELEVDDTAGVLPATARERVPPALFRRGTPLTQADAAIVALAEEIGRGAGESLLDRCHALKSRLHATLDHRTAEPEAMVGPFGRTAAEVLASGEGDPADVAQVFVAAARALGAPARLVTGYIWRGDRSDAGGAAHAWAEVFVDGLGWVGFDAPADRCPTDAYVRVSAGLDKAGAAFLRGAEHAGTLAGFASRAMITQADI